MIDYHWQNIKIKIKSGIYDFYLKYFKTINYFTSIFTTIHVTIVSSRKKI